MKSIKNKTKNFANLISAKLSSNVSYGLIVFMTSVLVLNCPSSSSSSGGTLPLTLANNDFFGVSIADVGDLDGGGGTVIAVGASGDNTVERYRGAIYLLSYNGTGTLTGTAKVDSSTINGPTLADNDAFGFSIANVEDLDGCGGTVIAVGANQDKTGGTHQGAIHLLSFDASGMLTGTTKVDSSTTNGPTLANRDFFASSIANVGDLDGDGEGGTVIAVGATGDTGDDTRGRDRGAIHLLLHNATGTLTRTTKVRF